MNMFVCFVYFLNDTSEWIKYINNDETHIGIDNYHTQLFSLSLAPDSRSYWHKCSKSATSLNHGFADHIEKFTSSKAITETL